MNELLALVIALLVYPGVIFGLVAAGIFGWMRGASRAMVHGWEGATPLIAPREFSRRLRQASTMPDGVALPIPQLLPVAALVAPLLVLVLLPFPGNRAVQGNYTLDIVAAGSFLLGMPVARIMLGWVIPSPYTRLAALRSARQLLGYLIPLGLALAVAALVGGTTNLTVLAGTTLPTTDHQSVYAYAARIVAGLAYAVCIPVLARLTPLRTGQGAMDLVGSELTELSGRELLIMRLAEWVQLIAVLGLGIVLFIFPFFKSDLARGLAALGTALIVAVLLGLWEGVGRHLLGRDEMPAPFSVWLGTPTLVGVFAVLLLIFAQR
jgi:formate hydrogenlyase subunit 4